MTYPLGLGRAALLVGALLGNYGCAVASETPTREELQAKSSSELEAVLHSKGLTCRDCIDKDAFIERVIQTWDRSGNEVASPDGKIRLSKDIFVNELKASYKKLLHEMESESENQEGGERSGHQLAGDDQDEDDDADASDPAEVVDRLWEDFGDRFYRGEIKMDESGRKIARVLKPKPPQTWWMQYKTHIMMMINLGMLWLMQRARRSDPPRSSNSTDEGQKRASGAAGAGKPQGKAAKKSGKDKSS